MRPEHVLLAAALALSDFEAPRRTRTPRARPPKKAKPPKAGRVRAAADYPRCACGQMRRHDLPACRTCLKKGGRRP